MEKPVDLLNTDSWEEARAVLVREQAVLLTSNNEQPLVKFMVQQREVQREYTVSYLAMPHCSRGANGPEMPHDRNSITGGATQRNSLSLSQRLLTSQGCMLVGSEDRAFSTRGDPSPKSVRRKSQRNQSYP